MIKNEKQYQIAKKNLKGFRDALAGYEKRDDKSSYIVRLEMNAVKHHIKNFEAEIEEFENLQNGNLSIVSLNSLDDVPGVLIKARIAKQLTQAALADKVGLKEQQIQKYEATDYAGASVLRLQRILDALGVTIPPTTVQINTPKFDTDDISVEILHEGQEKLRTRRSFCL